MLRISFFLPVLLCLTGFTFCQTNSDVKKVRDLVIYQDTNYYSTFPSVIKKQDGEILVAFRRAPNRRVFGEKGNNHVDPNSFLVTVHSRDNGLSWSSEPRLLYAHPWGGSQDPCLLHMKDGTMLCTSYGWAFLRNKDNLKEPYFESMENTIFLGGYYLKSEDGGATWDGPHYPPKMPPEVKFSATGEPLPAYNRGALYEGEDGRLFWAVAGSIDSEDLRRTSVHLLISEDQGDTWKYSSPIASDDDVAFNETSMYETPKGDLVAFLRTARFDDQACIARSVDGGKSFSFWKSMGFQGHPLQATRLPDDRVLLVYGYRHKPYGIRARILNAECTNYDTAEEIVLRTDGGTTDIGYPWAVVLDDKRVLVTYYFNKDDGPRHIAGTILEID